MDDKGNKKVTTVEAEMEHDLQLEQSKITCTEDLCLHKVELRQFNDNEKKVFSMTLNNFCTKTTKNWIEGKSD